MYESFYGLKEKPFTLLPDPEYLYLSPKHQRALTLLEYGMMNQAGFSVICGDTGAGKTTLIRRLLAELEENTTVGLITNTHQSFGELLNWVLMAFGLDGEGKSKAQMHQIFIEFLIEQYAQNRHTVLIVDEAQNMQADTLEELRMLSNINADKDQVLQVILAGQPALRETLRKPELMQFAQRIAVDYYLEALSEEETRSYIQHRLHVAGADQQIFTDDACKAIYKYSGGTPRLINLLCDTSLVYGFAEQTKTIDAGLVHDVVREQHSNSIIPTFNTSQPHKTDSLPPVQPEPVITETIVSTAPAETTPVQPANHETTEQRSSGEKPAVAQTKPEPASEVHPAKPVPKQDDAIAGLAERAAKAMSREQAGDMASNKQAVTETPATEIESGQDAIDKAVIDDAADDRQKEAAEDQVRSYEEEVAPYRTQRSYRDDSHGEEHYPIVHIEDNPRKGINMMLIGLVIGMFIASVMMMALAWMMLDDRKSTESVEQSTSTSSSSADVHQLQLEALKKERDAALTVTRALERERDAAMTAAKAQEQMRAAELRAAEILAEQERKTEARLKEARARAREAEIAEAKARERERAIQIRAQQRAAELEAQLEAERIETLKAERKKQELLVKQRAVNTQILQESVKSEPEVPVVTAPQQETNSAPVVKVVESKPADTDTEKVFSANPCNSPSAKFLSTCKR